MDKKKYGLVVTLDVKNNFNSANYGHVMTALHKMKVPGYQMRILEKYFVNRVLECDSDKVCYGPTIMERHVQRRHQTEST